MVRIAIVRGRNLNKFEMQSYEPLTKWFDITGYTTYNNNYLKTDKIDFKIKRLHCIEEITDRLPKLLRFSSAYVLLKYGYMQYMFGLEKELQIKDIVHTAEIFNGYSYQAIKAKKKNKKLKVVLTVWENIPFHKRGMPNFYKVGVQQSVKEKIIQNTDAFIAVTNRAKESLMLEGVPENKIHVIPAGVDIRRFKPRKKDSHLLKSLGIAEDEIVMLFVGRLVWEKGIYTLLFSLKKLLLDHELKDKK